MFVLLPFLYSESRLNSVTNASDVITVYGQNSPSSEFRLQRMVSMTTGGQFVFQVPDGRWLHK